MIFTLRNLLRWSLTLAVVGIYFVMGFNCSASKMHSLLGNGTFESSSISKTENLPYALLNAEQALASMLNVTEQAQPTTGIRNEYNVRNSSFSVNNYLSSMNAPMLLSATSLAGEVCNGLIQRERGLAANQRLFFSAVNFAAGPDQIRPADYQQTLGVFAQKVWGRSLASEEMQFFTDYYSEFLLTLTPAERAQTVKTTAFYISVCSAVLSSFDSLIY